MLPLYLDYAATTPVDRRVMTAMYACLGFEGAFGNPASPHDYGQQAAQKVEHARAQVAALIGAEPREILWTSGATEANNLALQGVAYFYKNRGQHIITVKTEHKAVLDVCAFLKKQGFEITYLFPGSDGILDPQQLTQALRPDTLLVSIMQVNNETGVIQPLEEIAPLVKANHSFLHVDAAQSLGKLPIDLRQLPVDLMSFSAHKIYGPKGAGALYVRHRPVVRLQPLFYGGGQEQGRRSGTLATHQIVGMGEACAILQNEMPAEVVRIQALKQRFLDGLWQHPTLKTTLGIHGNYQRSSCHIVNLFFPGIDSDVLMQALPQLALSSGSACTALELQPSHVLQAMGVPDAVAHRSLRFSFGRMTTNADVDHALQLITQCVDSIQSFPR